MCIEKNPQLEAIPDNLLVSKHLFFVRLASCGLKVLPSNWEHIYKLDYVQLYKNQLKDLPQNLWAKLPDINVLNIGGNYIQRGDIPTTVREEDRQKITWIY